jgi:hypothetical protein
MLTATGGTHKWVPFYLKLDFYIYENFKKKGGE